MDGHRGRKVHITEIDGVSHNAYATSITFSMTLDDLMHAIAITAITATAAGDHFQGTLSHNRIARESFWSERDTAEARRVAARIGPGRVYDAARSALRANGEGWRSQRWGDFFPPEVAKQRAEALFPMLRNTDNPFAPAPKFDDR